MDEIVEQPIMSLDRLHREYINCEDCPRKMDLRNLLHDECEKYLSMYPLNSKFNLQYLSGIVKRLLLSRADRDGGIRELSKAFFALTRYACNIMAQPWRQEFKSIKVFGGYYQDDIGYLMTDAEELMNLIGYKLENNVFKWDYKTSSEMFMYQLPCMALDYRLAAIECLILSRILHVCNLSEPNIEIRHVLEYREKHTGTWQAAVKGLLYEYRMQNFNNFQAPPYFGQANYYSGGNYIQNLGMTSVNMPVNTAPQPMFCMSGAGNANTDYLNQPTQLDPQAMIYNQQAYVLPEHKNIPVAHAPPNNVYATTGLPNIMSNNILVPAPLYTYDTMNLERSCGTQEVNSNNQIVYRPNQLEVNSNFVGYHHSSPIEVNSNLMTFQQHNSTQDSRQLMAYQPSNTQIVNSKKIYQQSNQQELLSTEIGYIPPHMDMTYKPCFEPIYPHPVPSTSNSNQQELLSTKIGYIPPHMDMTYKPCFEPIYPLPVPMTHSSSQDLNAQEPPCHPSSSHNNISTQLPYPQSSPQEMERKMSEVHYQPYVPDDFSQTANLQDMNSKELSLQYSSPQEVNLTSYQHKTFPTKIKDTKNKHHTQNSKSQTIKSSENLESNHGPLETADGSMHKRAVWGDVSDRDESWEYVFKNLEIKGYKKDKGENVLKKLGMPESTCENKPIKASKEVNEVGKMNQVTNETIVTENIKREVEPLSGCWTCSHCTLVNQPQISICVICAKSRNPGTEQRRVNCGKLCKKCTLLNPSTRDYCDICGSFLGEEGDTH